MAEQNGGIKREMVKGGIAILVIGAMTLFTQQLNLFKSAADPELIKILQSQAQYMGQLTVINANLLYAQQGTNSRLDSLMDLTRKQTPLLGVALMNQDAILKNQSIIIKGLIKQQ